MKTEKNRLVLILVAVIVVLLGVVVYTFAIRPAINGYAVKTYNGGVQNAVLAIMQQAAQCPSTGVPLTYGNTTITLVAVECWQQALAQQEQTTGS